MFLMIYFVIFKEGKMFEKFNVFLLVPENVEISFIKDENGQVKGKYSATIDDNDFNMNIKAKSVYEFFSKLCSELGVEVGEKDIRKEYYSLITFDQMTIHSEGECEAISKANKKRFLEKFENHNDLDSFFSTLQKQVTTFQDYFSPIQNYME